MPISQHRTDKSAPTCRPVAFLVIVPQTLAVLHDYEHMVLGLVLMLAMIFLRAGIVPTLARLLRVQPA